MAVNIINIDTYEQGEELGRKAAEEMLKRILKGEVTTVDEKTTTEVENEPEVETPQKPGTDPSTGTSGDPSTDDPSTGEGTGDPSTGEGTEGYPGGDPSTGEDPGDDPGDDPGSDPGTDPSTGEGPDGDPAIPTAPPSKKPVTSKPPVEEPTPGPSITSDPSIAGEPDNPYGKDGVTKVNKIDFPETKIYDGEYDINDGEHITGTEELTDILQSSGIDKSDPAWGNDNAPWADLEKEIRDVMPIIDEVYPKEDEEGGLGGPDPYRKKLTGKIRANRDSIINWKGILKRYLKKGKMRPTDEEPKDNVASDVFGTFIPDDPILSEPTGKRLVVFIDTSGSVTANGSILQQFVREFIEIAKSCKIKSVDLYTFSDAVYNCMTGEDGHVAVELNPKKISTEWGLINTKSGDNDYWDCYDTIYENYYKKHREFDAIVFLTDTDLAGYGSNVFDINKYLKKCTPDMVKAMHKWAKKSFWIIFKNYGDEKMAVKNVPIGTPLRNIMLVNQSMFMKSLHMKTNEELSEAFVPGKSGAEKISTMKKGEKNIRNIEDAEEKRKAIRRNAVAAARTAGTLKEYAEKITGWMDSNYKNLKFIDAIDQKGIEEYGEKNVYMLTDDLEIIVKNSTPFVVSYVKQIPDYIVFDKIYGDLHIQDMKVNELPPYLFREVIGGNLELMCLPNIKTLNNCPVIKGDGEVSIFGCTNLSKDALDAYSAKVGKEIFTDVFEMEIPNNNMKKLIESRIALGNAYLNGKLNEGTTAINEEFGSNVLNTLYTKNRDRMPLITKAIDIDWHEVDDNLVEYYKSYGEVKDLLNHTKDVNRQKGMYGVMIFTDSADKINFVSAGKSAEHDTTWVNPEITDILERRTKIAFALKKQFTTFKVDYANFLRGSYSETDRTNDVTLQKFTQNLAYIYLCWLYSTGKTESGYPMAVKMQADNLWTNDNKVGVDTSSVDKLRAHREFCAKLGMYTDNCSWNFSAYDRDKFFLVTKNAQVENILNPELIRTILQSINIRTAPQNAPVYDYSDIASGDVYTIFDELRQIDVRDSLVFNLKIKDNLPISNKITQFLQLEMVPDYVSRLYYISIKDTHHRIEDVIDTPENRKANFNIASQKRYIAELRKKRAAGIAGMTASTSKTLRNDPKVNKDLLVTDDQIRTANKSVIKANNFTPLIGEDGKGGSLGKMVDSVKKKLEGFTGADDTIYVKNIRAAALSADNEDKRSGTEILQGLMTKADKFLRELIASYKDAYDKLKAIPIKFTEDNILEYDYYNSYTMKDKYVEYYNESHPDGTIRNYDVDTTSKEFKEFAAKYLMKARMNRYDEILAQLDKVFDVTKFYTRFINDSRKIYVNVDKETPEAMEDVNKAVQDIVTLCSQIYNDYRKKDEKSVSVIDKSIKGLSTQITALNNKNTSVL